MRFPDRFLEELKAALPVINVVQRRYKLRKAGSAEYKAVDDESLSVNTSKNVWRDFGKGDKGGDIFAFEMFATGCTFEEAVESLAKLAGLPLPKGSNPKANGHANGPLGPEPPPHEGRVETQRPHTREITASYDYLTPDGILLYQVVRQEWLGDDGRRKKSFLQRRPYGPVLEDRNKQSWVWGLGEGVFLRGNDGNFYAATKERVARWTGAERIEVEAVPHVLYRWPELREELAQEPNERRTIFCVEGERDCETLVEWGMVCTTNSGGAGNWRPEHAEELRDANVVVLLDNDTAGRKRGHEVALSLKNVAASVKVLSWPDHWRGCPDGGDVTDWRDQAGGDAAKLFEIVDSLAEWSPEPPVSTYSAVRFVDAGRGRSGVDWLVKGILQRRAVSLWYGPPSCGKSFLLTDASLAIARGLAWMGRRARPGLVVYQTGEGGDGFDQRVRAYRQHERLLDGEDLPFVYLPMRINLYADDAEPTRLIEEIKAWTAFYDHPLELVVIDTFNAASGGANENANQDVGRVLERCRRIVDETGAHVALVHHTPASGDRPRGHTSLLADVETGVAVLESDQVAEGEADDGHTVTRTVRTWTLVKQKDGESKLSGSFVLKRVVLGKDEDGDDVSSCVVLPLQTAAAASAVKRVVPDGWAQLNRANEDIMRSLVRALRKRGRQPTDDDIKKAPFPPKGELCCTIKDWQDEMLELVIGHEDITPTVRQRIKMKIYRASKSWLPDERNLIVKSGDFVWRTDRKVYMIDELPVSTRRPEQQPIAAPGEPPDLPWGDE